MSWEEILKEDVMNWLKQNTQSYLEKGHIKMIEGAIEANEMIRLRKLNKPAGTTNGFFIEFTTKIPILTDNPEEIMAELQKKLGTSSHSY
tara:strand:+ start:470 stop:739 length:270 start_codon:yes stop_codon:yes gene_type:complete